MDQFRYGVFGGIGPTALAVGTPLVTDLDHSKSAWYMEEPSYFEAWDVETCYRAMRDALSADRSALVTAMRGWMERNYWHEDVAIRHAELYRDALAFRPPVAATPPAVAPAVNPEETPIRYETRTT